MRPSRLSLALCAALCSSTILAEQYTATVPVVQGDLHQARREALKQILLEVGQTGGVQVASSSSLIGTELRETIRLQANYRLKTFKITEEVARPDSLQLSAIVNSADASPDTCPAPVVQFRNTRLKWLPSEQAEDPEAELLLKIATMEALEKALSNAIQTQDDPTAPAYTVQIQPSGKLGFFSKTLQLNVGILGADQKVIAQLIFPATIRKLTQEVTHDAGSVTFKSSVLSAQAMEWIQDVSQQIAGKYACLPAISVVPPNTHHRIHLSTSTENASGPKPVVFYSQQWPIRAGGEIDLISLENFLPVLRVDSKKITLEVPKSTEGYGEASAPLPNRGGYLLFY